MKIRFLHLLFACLLGLLTTGARANESTYIGPDLGNWGKAANWSPANVPDNGGGMTFDVTITDYSVTLNINPTIGSLALGGDSAGMVRLTLCRSWVDPPRYRE